MAFKVCQTHFTVMLFLQAEFPDDDVCLFIRNISAIQALICTFE